MQILKKTLKLNSLTPLILNDSSLWKKIAANYQYFLVDVSADDLLHLTSEEQEDEQVETENQSFVIHLNHHDNRQQKVEMMNNWFHRVLQIGTIHFSYQDEVFVTQVLYKLGITQAEEFMKQVQTLYRMHSVTNGLIKEYVEQKDEFHKMILKNNQENTLSTKTIPRYYMQEKIFKHLATNELTNIVYEYYKIGQSMSPTMNRMNILFAEHLKMVQMIQAAQVREEALSQCYYSIRSFPNYYENYMIPEADINEKNIKVQIISAALLHLTDMINTNLYKSVLKNQRKGSGNDLQISNSMYNGLTNLLVRFREKHVLMQWNLQEDCYNIWEKQYQESSSQYYLCEEQLMELFYNPNQEESPFFQQTNEEIVKLILQIHKAEQRLEEHYMQMCTVTGMDNDLFYLKQMEQDLQSPEILEQEVVRRYYDKIFQLEKKQLLILKSIRNKRLTLPEDDFQKEKSGAFRMEQAISYSDKSLEKDYPDKSFISEPITVTENFSQEQIMVHEDAMCNTKTAPEETLFHQENIDKTTLTDKVIGNKTIITKQVFSDETTLIEQVISDKAILINQGIGDMSTLIAQGIGDKITLTDQVINNKAILINQVINDETNLNDQEISDKVTLIDQVIGNKTTLINQEINEAIGNNTTLYEQVIGDKTTLNDPVISDKTTLNDPVISDKATLNDSVIGDKTTLMEQVIDDKTTLMNQVIGDKTTLMNQVIGDKTTSMEEVIGDTTTLMEQSIDDKVTLINSKIGNEITLLGQGINEATTLTKQEIDNKSTLIKQGNDSKTDLIDQVINDVSTLIEQKNGNETILADLVIRQADTLDDRTNSYMEKSTSGKAHLIEEDLFNEGGVFHEQKIVHESFWETDIKYLTEYENNLAKNMHSSEYNQENQTFFEENYQDVKLKQFLDQVNEKNVMMQKTLQEQMPSSTKIQQIRVDRGAAIKNSIRILEHPEEILMEMRIPQVTPTERKIRSNVTEHQMRGRQLELQAAIDQVYTLNQESSKYPDDLVFIHKKNVAEREELQSEHLQQKTMIVEEQVKKIEENIKNYYEKNMNQQVTHTIMEELKIVPKLIEQNLKSQSASISELVYRKLERKLTEERKRRGY